MKFDKSKALLKQAKKLIKGRILINKFYGDQP